MKIIDTRNWTLTGIMEIFRTYNVPHMFRQFSFEQCQEISDKDIDSFINSEYFTVESNREHYFKPIILIVQNYGITAIQKIANN